MYLSIASLSGPDWEYGQPLDGTVPERKVMVQSYGLLRDKVVACTLLKNSGTFNRSGNEGKRPRSFGGIRADRVIGRPGLTAEFLLMAGLSVGYVC